MFFTWGRELSRHDACSSFKSQKKSSPWPEFWVLTFDRSCTSNVHYEYPTCFQSSSTLDIEEVFPRPCVQNITQKIRTMCQTSSEQRRMYRLIVATIMMVIHRGNATARIKNNTWEHKKWRSSNQRGNFLVNEKKTTTMCQTQWVTPFIPKSLNLILADQKFRECDSRLSIFRAGQSTLS